VHAEVDLPWTEPVPTLVLVANTVFLLERENMYKVTNATEHADDDTAGAINNVAYKLSKLLCFAKLE